MAPPPADLSRLLSQTTWVQELARALVLDANSADDAAQETFLAALRGGPRDGRPLGPWLVAVLRNAIRQRSRSDSRRLERESRAAKPDRAAGADSIVERASLHRELTEAVLALDEPYRTTILLRYFDGLPPRRIAEQLGTPVNTVRTHLARGLERLRAALDRSRGAWVVAFAPLAELPLSTGVALMNAKVTAALAAGAAALAVGGVTWIRYSPGAATSPPSSSAERAGAEAPIVVAAASEPSAGGRVAASSIPSSGPASDPIGLIVYGSAKDTAGRAVLPNVGLENEEGETVYGGGGAESSYVILGATPGTWILRARASGYANFEKAIPLDGTVPRTRVDLTLVPSGVLRVHFVTPEGKWLAEELRAKGVRSLDGRSFMAVATVDPPPPRFPSINMDAEIFGVSRFQSLGDDEGRSFTKGTDGLLKLEAPPPLYVSALLRHIVVATERVVPGQTEVTLTVNPEDLIAQLGGVRVSVVDAVSGKPVSGASVSVDSWYRSGGGVRTGADGLAEIKNQDPGPGTLRIHAKDFAFHQQPVVVKAGQVADLGVVKISAPVSVRGRVVGFDVAPTSGTIGVLSRDGPFPLNTRDTNDGWRLESDGTFELSLSQGHYLVFYDRKEAAPAVAFVDTTSGPVDGVVLDLRRGTPVKIRIGEGAPRYLDLTIRDSTQQPIASRVVTSKRVVPMRLVPGTYEMLVRDERGVVVKIVPIEVGSEPLSIPLEL